MSIYIFSGPSIKESHGRQILEANYLPPVSQGDIVSLLRYKPRIIGIVDGYFDRVPAVWHKEILLAMSQGVIVVGGASMGALRAAELYPFGMVGIGRIFEWYRDGIIDADDEVAVLHAAAEFDYMPFTEAMVNIRQTLKAAEEAGIISPDSHQRLVELGRDIHYSERSYDRLIAAGTAVNLPPNQLAALSAFVKTSPIDLKHQDAIDLLTYIANLPHDPPRPEPTFQLNVTAFLDQLMDTDTRLSSFDDVPLRIDELINYLRFEEEGFRALNERAVDNSILLKFARELKLAVDVEEIEAETAAFQNQHNLQDDPGLEQWRGRNRLTTAELHTFLEELALLRKVKALYHGNSSFEAIIRQLLMENKFEAAFKGARDKAAVLLENFSPPEDSLDQLIETWFANRGQPIPDDLYQYARDLGFWDYNAFILELEKSYQYRLMAQSKSSGVSNPPEDYNERV